MEFSGTSYVLLGMLRIGLRTGYDIKQVVDKSVRFFWAASYGQIYPELKKLEQAGLVRGEADPQGGRQRQAYSLTGSGEQVLLEWLRTPDVASTEMRDQALLKLFFADAVDPADAAALARVASERHAAVVESLAALDPPEGMTRVVRDFGIDFHSWCTERFARMEQDLKEES